MNTENNNHHHLHYLHHYQQGKIWKNNEKNTNIKCTKMNEEIERKIERKLKAKGGNEP